MSGTSDGIRVSVHVEEGTVIPWAAEQVEAVLAEAVAAEGVGEAEISVAFVGDERIMALNQDYLLHEGPTDVISFPLHGEGQPVIGDVYVGAAQAARQASELGVEIRAELLRLAIHGVLHVLGHDHPEDDDREASPMYRRQEELLENALRRLAR
jgi:probable rRNA maturation factor